MANLLECIGLEKSYGKTEALKGIDLSVQPGRIVGLLGPNGSGKTTLIKLINGLLKPTKGELKIAGNVPGPETKKIVAYLPDRSFLNSWMTIEQIVNMFQDFFSDFRTDRAYEMLERLGLDKKTQLKTLSKGNKEKVCLILTMARDAKLYVLDEPIAGVDPATRDYILETIIQNRNEDATVLISTHLISDVEPVLDDVIFIQNGEITLCKSASEIHNEGKTIDGLFREVYRW